MNHPKIYIKKYLLQSNKFIIAVIRGKRNENFKFFFSVEFLHYQIQALVKRNRRAVLTSTLCCSCFATMSDDDVHHNQIISSIWIALEITFENKQYFHFATAVFFVICKHLFIAKSLLILEYYDVTIC